MPGNADDLREHLRAANPGLAALVEHARSVWVDRAVEAGHPAGDATHLDPLGPRWQPFEDQFPTFYQFTNRPR